MVRLRILKENEEGHDEPAKKVIRQQTVSYTVVYPKYNRKITIKVVKKYGKLLKAVGEL